MELHDFENKLFIYCEEKNILNSCFVVTFHIEHTGYGTYSLIKSSPDSVAMNKSFMKLGLTAGLLS